MNKIFLIASGVFFLIAGNAAAQSPSGLVEGTAKEFTTCPGATQTYYFKGASDATCLIKWTVINGVFPDYSNAATHDDQTQPGTNSGIVSIKVKWNISGTTGALSVAASGCSMPGTAVLSKTFTHNMVPAMLTATPSTITAGATVSLGVSYTNNPYTITGVDWTNSNGFGKTGNPVTDTPPATTAYSAQIKYNVVETSTRACIAKKDITVNVSGTNPPPTTPPTGGSTGIPAADPSQLILNDVMCCSQCLTPSQTPTGLAHDTSVPAMSGGTTPSYTYIWYKSADGIKWTPYGNSNATILPPKVSQTMWYVRTVNTVPGNIMRVSVANTDITVGAHTNVLGYTLEASNSITIQGDQSPATGSKFFFNSGSTITVLPNTILSPNTYLQIGQPCLSTANGRIASSTELQTEVFFTESDSLSNVTTPYSADNSLFSISPNPSRGETKFLYKTSQPGFVKIVVLDNTGKKISTLVDSSVNEGTHEVRVDTKDWKPGMYLFKLNTSGYRTTLKLVVDQ